MSSGPKRACVIGWPLAHSLSPKLHGYWLKEYGIKGSYEAMPVKPGDLERTIRALPQEGFSGGNVTIPHKEAVMAFLDTVDNTAKAIGAVNTITVKNGKLHGTNTDAYGFMENLREHARFTKNKAVVLGAGGAARAVCKALWDEGFKQVVIVNRTLSKAEALAAHFGKRFVAVSWDKRAEALENADLLINATSLGLEKSPPLVIDLDKLPARAVVTDIVYVPLMTPLLAEAKKRGHKTVDGLGMLLHQAVPGFAAWFGRTPEVDGKVRTHLLEGA